MTTPYDVLVAARNIIADKDRWMTSSLVGRKRDGTDCYCALGAVAKAAGLADDVSFIPDDPDHPQEVRWITSGDEVALYSALASDPTAATAVRNLAAFADDYRRQLGLQRGHGDEQADVYAINDQGGHTTILDLFDQTIRAMTASVATVDGALAYADTFVNDGERTYDDETATAIETLAAEVRRLSPATT